MEPTIVVSGKLFEVVNGALFFAFIFITLKVFAPFLVSLWHEKRSYKYRWDAFRRDGGPAIALVVWGLGDSVVRGPVWFQRWVANHHYLGLSLDPAKFITIIIMGVMIALLGTWCVARVYGTARDGTLAVVLSVGLALALAWPWGG